MSTSSGKRARREKKEEGFATPDTFKEIKPLNFAQEMYLNSIKHNDIIFGIGSAGTGKTYVPAAYAASELYHKRIERIIVTRPNVEVGRSMGFLPGTLDEKFLPYLAPFASVFSKYLGQGFYEWALKSKTIDPRPIAYMRGETFENCIVLIDEAQNITNIEFKMLLTRIGRNCKMIISGDSSQSDIPDSGLEDTLDIVEGIHGVDVIEFLDSDIVRSKLCKSIILAYNR